LREAQDNAEIGGFKALFLKWVRLGDQAGGLPGKSWEKGRRRKNREGGERKNEKGGSPLSQGKNEKKQRG
jgi:hypothetical protein